jgi:hypothetical protein
MGNEVTMARLHESKMGREARSPRAAAVAGIAYSILIITVMLLTRRAGSIQPETFTRELLETYSGVFSVVFLLVPFAGIALLWFTGVVRDLLGEQEDRFFSTIFFGSGIIHVLLLFVWGAFLGTILRMKAIDTLGMDGDFSLEIFIFSIILMNEVIGNFALRMAGVYMTAIATLWTRTGLMPRWLTLATYLLAIGFLVAAERIREARFIFPLWVFVVSIYILFMNYRRSEDLAIKNYEE